MIATNEYHALHRKNRKNKSEMQASQEMVNAFDKISESVRRAHNVNRCQQDHLHNKVSTLENEHRKSMGLLAHEQKRFIRTRKSSNIPLRPEHKMSNFSVATGKDGIKTSFRLPSLVNEYHLQDDDYGSVESFKRHALNRKGFVGLKHRNSVQRQDITKRIHLSSIHETQLNKAGQLKEKDVIESRRGPADKWTSRNAGVRRDTIDKQQYVASWDISANEKTSKTTGKSYNNVDKTPLTLNSQLCMDESISTKPKTQAYCNNKTIAENPDGADSNTAFSVRSKDSTKNEYPSLSNKKFHLVRSSTNTTSELESILDKTTEIRVKQFLKLPPIGGIHESPSLEQPHSDAKNLKSESLGNRRSSQVNLDISLDMRRRRPKSSLWKNLVHCRYLRLGEQHVHEHGITNKKCECNWCAMMRKSET